MPIIRIGPKLIYFAHVPKCAGTAVETYLSRRFGRQAMAFLDSGHLELPGAVRWSLSSPQHIDTDALARLFPAGFFDASFAVVRHPALRLRSVYRYQRDVQRRIDPGTGFSAWLEGLHEQWERDPWYLDNHTRPMAEIVPDGARFFRLEDGLGALVAWLDEQAGQSHAKHREIAPSHTLAERLAAVGHDPGPDVRLSAADLAWVATLYAEDYARFGYGETLPLTGE